MCVVTPFILDARLVDVPAGVTQEEGQIGFLRLPSAILALIFLARRIQAFLSLVDRRSWCGRCAYQLVHGDLPRQHPFGTTLRFTSPVPADSRH